VAGAAKVPSDWARTGVPPTSTSAGTGISVSSSMTKPVTMPSLMAAPLMILKARSSSEPQAAASSIRTVRTRRARGRGLAKFMLSGAW
jgi:hypothetical protein